MKRIKLFTAALLLAAISAGNDVWALSDSRKKDTRPVESPQFFSGNANPDRKSTRLNSSHIEESRMPSSA